MINSEVWKDFISLFYPRICFVCDQSLVASEEVVCTHCLLDLPLIHESDHETLDRFQSKFAVLVQSSFQFPLMRFHNGGAAQKLLHKLKYENQYRVGTYLGEILAKKLIRLFKEKMEDIDLIIPVPIHPSKKKIRGYNQSEAIIEGMISVLNLQYDFDNLVRVKKTATQTKKTKIQRWKNVENIYDVKDPSLIAGQSILLV